MDSPKVFISYSYDSPEHEQRVRMLADRLRREGIDCTIDQYDEAPTNGLLRWMARQVKASDFVLLVCTETYARRAEENEQPGKGHGVLWESNLIYNEFYAAGTVSPKFIPVLFHPRDSSHIPGPFTGVTYYCIENEAGYEKLYRRLTKQPRIVKPPVGEVYSLPPDQGGNAVNSLGKLVNVPSLPPHFLGRREHLEAIKAAVLAEEGGSSVGVTGVGATGVQGMGGIGKSVLTAAVAHDPGVRQAFRDGIYWLPVGREPNLLELQNQLLRQVGEPQQSFTTSQDARNALREALDGRHVLVVLDDVWQADHAYELCESCAPARLLITTRDAEVLAAVGAAEHRVDVLSPNDALTMLANWASEKADALPLQAAEVAKECGNLPLALAAVGAMVRRRPSGWGDALARLRSADLATIRRAYPGYPYPNLLRALEVSIDALEEVDRERYLDLAVFRDDQPIPEGTLSQLWSLSPLATRDCMAHFVDRSLAVRTEDEDEALILHDLLRDVIRRRREATLTQVHMRLLHAWDSELRLPDRYAWRWAAYHLMQANREADLRRLLSDLNYLQAKLDVAGVNALLADYEYVSGESDMRTIRSAIRLSAHALSKDGGQLAAQVRGRLLHVRSSLVRSLLNQTLQPPHRCWLLPLTESLIPADSSLLPTFDSHSDLVWSVAVTGDGRRAVSGSADGTVRVWDLASGQSQVLEGHMDSVTSVAVTSDGRRAVSGSAHGTVRVWDLANGQSEVLEGHTNWIWSVVMTDDGRRAVSGSADRTVRVWDLESGQSQMLEGHTNWVWSVVVTGDGRCAVSGSADGAVRVWDLASGQSQVLEGHTDWVKSVAVMGDGRCAVSGSADGTVRVWNLASRESQVLEGHTDWIRSLVVTDDGGRVLSGSNDGTVRVWDLADEQSQVLEGHTSWVWSVAVTGEGRYAVSSSDDWTVRVWDLASGNQSAIFTADAGIQCCAITPDGRTIVAGDTSGRVHFLRYLEPDPNEPPLAKPPFRLLGSS